MNNLQFAIKMEQDGERYYKQQAKLNKDNVLRTVCTMLAEEENNHTLILKNKLSEKLYSLAETIYFKDKNVFEGMKDLKSEEKALLSQLDFYRIAAAKEKQSIALYTKYLMASAGTKSRELYEYLIKQEQQHYEFIDTLSSLLSHPEEWVENAEFGNRQEN
ncbi:MAG: ferritin family protein [Clostridia bacterium]